MLDPEFKPQYCKKKPSTNQSNNNKKINLFPHSSGGWRSEVRVPACWVWWGTFYWLAGDCLSCAHKALMCPERGDTHALLIKPPVTTNPIGLGHDPVTSFNFLTTKSPVSNYSPTGRGWCGSGFNIRIWGGIWFSHSSWSQDEGSTAASATQWLSSWGTCPLIVFPALRAGVLVSGEPVPLVYSNLIQYSTPFWIEKCTASCSLTKL